MKESEDKNFSIMDYGRKYLDMAEILLITQVV